MYKEMPFTGNRLDRAHAQRTDEGWLRERLAHPASQFLALRDLEPLIRSGEGPVLAWRSGEQIGGPKSMQDFFLLGVEGGRALYAFDAGRDSTPAAALAADGAGFQDARSVAAGLTAHEAGILAQARSFVDWHSRHSFCASCGGKTLVEHGGHQRHCPACGRHHFPRTDPVVIMVVWQGDECLLARRKGRPGSFFSTLAGFVDQGETIEDAVRREVAEEAGLQVDEVSYRASQPWPFPASLMLGCFARATGRDFSIDDDEIGEARWLRRAEVRQALRGELPGLQIPGSIAIAHHLIADWSATEP